MLNHFEHGQASPDLKINNILLVVANLSLKPVLFFTAASTNSGPCQTSPDPYIMRCWWWPT